MSSADNLRKLGLTDNETKVYLALLELGKAAIGEITKETNLHRSNVYDSISRLKEKGLVSDIIEGKKRLFMAEEPSVLVTYTEEKEKIAKEILPQLAGLYARRKAKADVRVFRGNDGRRALLQDELREGKDVYVLAATSEFKQPIEYYWSVYNERRAEKGVNLWYLARPESKESLDSWFDKLSKKEKSVTKLRYLSEEWSIPMSLFSYGEKAGVFIPSDEQLVILIESKKAADSFRKYFKALWTLSKH